MIIDAVILEDFGYKLLVMPIPSKKIVQVEVPSDFVEILGTPNQTSEAIWVDTKDIYLKYSD